MRKVFLIIISILILFGCNSSQIQNNNASKMEATEKLFVSNLCVLFNNPYPYHQKIIILKSTLYRLDSETTLGDEDCIVRHPVVDVEFSPKFKATVCGSKDAVKKKLCLIAKPDEKNKEESNLYVTADLSGYFEYYKATEGFSINHLRFNFVIQEINDIEEIEQIKVENVLD